MQDKPTTTDPIVAVQAAAEGAAFAEWRALACLIVARDEATHPDAVAPSEEGEGRA